MGLINSFLIFYVLRRSKEEGGRGKEETGGGRESPVVGSIGSGNSGNGSGMVQGGLCGTQNSGGVADGGGESISPAHSSQHNAMSTQQLHRPHPTPAQRQTGNCYNE